MRVCIHQPHLIPYEGLFGKISDSNVCIFITNTQYVKGEYLNRVRVFGSWVTLEVMNPKAYMSEVTVSARSVSKMRKAIQHNLFTTDHKIKIPSLVGLETNFNTVLDRHTTTGSPVKLEDLNFSLMQMLLDYLGIPTTLIKMEYKPVGETTTQRLMTILNQLESKEPITYLSGAGGLNYLEAQHIPSNVEVLIQTFNQPPNQNSILQSIALIGKDTLNKTKQKYSWTSFHRGTNV